MMALIERVSPTKANVLVIGESGTGKELVARLLHDLGPLRTKSFVPVNCGAIPENLIESEMFGHKKGSFTGAVVEKIGLFEVADGGTLFLDEVGELPLSMQVKLLRVIQERTFRKVGGTDDQRVDVRIIAATNRDLEEGVKRGTFREDLYYRLNVIQIRTPHLRERKEDIPLLVNHFLSLFCAKQNKPVPKVNPDVMSAFEAYAWPGNIRELENTIERAVTLESSGVITMESLPKNIGPAVALSSVSPQAALVSDPSKKTDTPFIDLPRPNFSRGPIRLDDILQDVERKYLMAALDHSNGVKKKASELLGITFRSIRYRLKKLGVASSDTESESDEGDS